MRLEDAEAWYRSRGFRVQMRPLLGEPEGRLRPDLLAERGAERRGVLCPERPAVAEDVRTFAERCRALGIVPVYAGPLTPEIHEVCASAAIDLLEGGTAPSRPATPTSARPEFLSKFQPQPASGRIVTAVFPRLKSPEGQAIVARARRRRRPTRWVTYWIVLGFLGFLVLLALLIATTLNP